MINKAMGRWVLGVPALLLVLILIIIWKKPPGDSISRATAARAIAMVLCSGEELSEWQESTHTSFFPIKEQDNWYVPCLDYLYNAGYLSEAEIPANEESMIQPVTYGELEFLLNKVSDSLGSAVRATKKNRNNHYPREEFSSLYETVIAKTAADGRIKKQIVQLFGTPGNAIDGKPWTAYTNLGEFRFDGLALDSYIDREIEVFTQGSEIIWMKQIISDHVIYKNAWIMEGEKDDLLVFLGSMKREMSYGAFFGKGKVYNQVADLTLKAGKLEKIAIKKARINPRVLAVHDTCLELEGYGTLELDEGFRVIKVYGTFAEQSKSDILVGYDLQEFVVAEGKICAALTIREFDAARVRVLLMTTGFSEAVHPAVRLVCDSTMTLIAGTETKKVPAGEILEITPESGSLRKGRMLLKADGDSGIEILSIERSQGHPVYPGQIEIAIAGGGLVVVNDVYLEDYLKLVVPSEMPSSYEKEALKAQAVCARTYAYMQIQGNRYQNYGAHVDDSTGFQVYNNIEKSTRTDAAVQETYGELLTCEGEPISAYYFSTSCGTTTDATVWGMSSDELPYLKGISLQSGRGTPSLTGNEEFDRFIKNKDYPAYDSTYSFYRWQTSTSSSRLQEKFDDIGTIQSVKVVERGTGGFVRQLEITGSDGSRIISGQNNVRSVLGDDLTAITTRDGSQVTGWSTLPSAFLTVEAGEKGSDGTTVFHIYGGGYGHGAGMSQNGAQGMAKQGKTYLEILKFFYEGVEIETKLSASMQ